MATSPPSWDASAARPQRPASARVLASCELFPAICAFLPGQPAWLAALERRQAPAIDELKLTLEARKGTGAPGLLPFLAIQQRDLRALARLWVLHKQPQFRKSSKYWFQSAMHDAATIGNVEALEWLLETTGEMCEPSAVSLAASNGHADVVRWHLAHHADFDLESAQRAMVKAACHGQLDVLKAFHEWRNDACTSQMMDLAAAHGQLEVVQYLHDHGGAGCSTAAVDGAAEGGHLEVVKWLLANREEGFTQAALRGAIEHAHLPVVQYMVEEHCRREGPNENLSTFTQGMRAGVPFVIRDRNLEMLRYLHDNMGHDAFPRYALSLAAESPRDIAIFRFLHSTHRPREDIDLALRRAIDDCVLMEYLLANETFSLDVLNDTLPRAIAVKDPSVSERNVLALQIAIAQKQQQEIDVGANFFAPTAPSKASTSNVQRGKSKPRKTATRATHPTRNTQAFLSLQSAPDASDTVWTRQESSAA